MPELPEVEFTRRVLLKWVGKSPLKQVAVGMHATDSDRAVARSAATLIGAPLLDISRRGKFLFLDFGDSGLSVHLGMTGKWVRSGSVGIRSRHERLRLRFDSETISFIDVRKFGYVHFTTASEWLSSFIVRRIGLDVYDPKLTAARFFRDVCKGRTEIKAALLDQGRIAGVGNIYACEALHDARISPFCEARRLSEAQATRLLASIRRSMSDALARETGDEIFYLTDGNPENPFQVYGRAGLQCFVCDQLVEKVKQQGRTTFYCANCNNVGSQSRER